MAGGLLQLVAYGAQDQLLTGNPVITFFKAIYRHHTNFSMESIRQTFNGNVGKNKYVVASISRHGDLLSDCWLEFSLPVETDISKQEYLRKSDISDYIESVELEIGGQRIDLHNGDFIHKYMNLTTSQERLNVLYPEKDFVVKLDHNGSSSLGSSWDGDDPQIITKDKKYTRMYIPLQFFFCRNPGLALPLIALQYHEVKFNIKFGKMSNILNVEPEVDLYCNYIYLDVDERKRFATTSHQMLIEQTQIHQEYVGTQGETNKKITLNFNHPVKELLISTDTTYEEVIPSLRLSELASAVSQPDPQSTRTVSTISEKTTKFLDFTYDTMRLMLNGQERFVARAPEFFKQLQPYQYHTCGDLVETPMHIYSFCIHPEEHQPSGTCNFSRIDNSVLEFQGAVKIESYDMFGIKKTSASGANLMIYAINYNILRITSGMGGLAFSN